MNFSWQTWATTLDDFVWDMWTIHRSIMPGIEALEAAETCIVGEFPAAYISTEINA